MKTSLKALIFSLLIVAAFAASAYAAEDDEAQFCVTIPAALPVAVDANGNVSVANDAKIINYSTGAVRLDVIRVEPQNGWQLSPWSTDYGSLSVDSKRFSMRLNGVDVPENGEVDVSACSAIASGGEMQLAYDAKLSMRSADMSETIASIVFTVSWEGHGPLSGIAVTTAPTKTAYNVGDAFQSRGMRVTATYADGTSAVVTGWTVTDGASLAEGQTSVTVSYTENGVTKTATTPITVEAKKLKSITITSRPTKLFYETGEEFDKSGMSVRADYTNGTSAYVTDYGLYVDPLTNSNTDGEVEIVDYMVIYTEGGVSKTDSSYVYVNNSLQYIRVTQNPTKTVYFDGDAFDPTGMSVVAYFTEGSRTLDYDDNDSSYLYYTIPSQTLHTGQTSVTIGYTSGSIYKTASVPVKVFSGPSPETIAIGESIEFGTLYMDGKELDGRYTFTYHTGNTLSFGDSDGVLSITWIKVSDNMLIANRNLLRGISWNALARNGLVYGSSVQIDGNLYTVRLLTGGTTEYDTDNEWSQYIANRQHTDSFWNMAREASLTQTIINDGYNDLCVLRGDNYEQSAWHNALMSEESYGFRPCLILE